MQPHWSFGLSVIECFKSFGVTFHSERAQQVLSAANDKSKQQILSMTLSIVWMLFLSRFAKNRDRKRHPCNSLHSGVVLKNTIDDCYEDTRAGVSRIH